MVSKRNKLFFAVFGFAILVAVLLVSGFYARRARTAAAPAASVPAPEEKVKAVALTERQLRAFGIELQTAGPGRLQLGITVPGEIVVNPDRVAHVVPRVSGVVVQVLKSVGDRVHAGETIAVLESRELADAKTAWLAAGRRVELAQDTFEREQNLWRRKISAEQEYIQAKSALTEARLERQAAEHALLALGQRAADISKVEEQAADTFARYSVTAPFDATVLERAVNLGEVVTNQTSVFKVADLRAVWVNLDVHQKDFAKVRIGQKALISLGPDGPMESARISYIDPVVMEDSRTIHARVVLSNPRGTWRPGLFVSARIETESVNVPVLVPQEALTLIDGRPALFVRGEQGFEPREVSTGRTDRAKTEITAGLGAGQVFAAKGAFTIKSEYNKPEVEE